MNKYYNFLLQLYLICKKRSYKYKDTLFYCDKICHLKMSILKNKIILNFKIPSDYS